MKRMIDIHNHVLFNVDDGSSSLEMSLSMAQQAANRGITDIVATPHQLEQHQIEKCQIRQEKVYNAYRILQEEIKKNNIPINLYLGSELYFSPLVKYAQNTPYFTYNDQGKYVLVEFSLTWRPNGHKELFYDLINNGCTPILAHPARYVYFWEIIEDIMDLIKMGTLVQINSGSLLGYNGKKAQYISELLLRKELVHIVASDAHKTRESAGFTLPIAVKEFSKKYPNIPFEDYTWHNPENIIENRSMDVSDEACYHFDVKKEKGIFTRKMFLYDLFHEENKKKMHKRRIYF